MNFFLLTIFLATHSTMVSAQEDKLAMLWTDAEKNVAEAVESIQKKCGVVVKASFDKMTFGPDVEKVKTAFWCAESLNSLASVCEDADYKSAVSRGGVKSIICKYDASVKKESPQDGVKLESKGGAVTFSYHKESANLSDRTRSFFKDNL